jgi:hypothetical protein
MFATPLTAFTDPLDAAEDATVHELLEYGETETNPENDVDIEPDDVSAAADSEIFDPTVADGDSEFKTSLAAAFASAVEVSENETLFERPDTVMAALTTSCSADAPAETWADARPLESEFTILDTICAEPDEFEKETGTPATAFPKESLTFTVIGFAKADPAGLDCPLPLWNAYC